MHFGFLLPFTLLLWWKVYCYFEEYGKYLNMDQMGTHEIFQTNDVPQRKLHAYFMASAVKWSDFLMV